MVDSQASLLISVQVFIVGVIRDHYLISDDPENPVHELYRSIEGRIIK